MMKKSKRATASKVAVTSSTSMIVRRTKVEAKREREGKGKVEQPHVAYKRIREQLIDVIKERGVNSREQAAQWVDETKERLDQVLADLSGELDETSSQHYGTGDRVLGRLAWAALSFAPSGHGQKARFGKSKNRVSLLKIAHLRALETAFVRRLQPEGAPLSHWHH